MKTQTHGYMYMKEDYHNTVRQRHQLVPVLMVHSLIYGNILGSVSEGENR